MDPAASSVPSASSAPERGLGGFLFLWFGQLVSSAGSQMTRFALILWAYEQTGQATSLALLGFSLFAPVLLLSPFAGALVDRFDRRRLLLGSSLLSAGFSLSLLVLAASGLMRVWHLYIAGVVTGAVQAVAFPAFSAAITLLVPPRQYGRASGMWGLAQSLAAILAPPLAALLLPRIGLSGVLILDIGSFGVAIATLWAVRIPSPAPAPSGGTGSARDRYTESLLAGFRYFAERRGARSLQLFFFFANLLGALSPILLAPAVLARSGGDQLALGLVQSAFGLGGVTGGVLLAVWGGPRRKVPAILAAVFLSTGVGQFALGLGQRPWTWAAAAFCIALFLPVINGLSLAIWQARIPAELQGRAFAAARLIAQLPLVCVFLLAGPLADRVFEPALEPGGALSARLGWLVGQGDGAGMGLMFLLSGGLGALVALTGFLTPAVRDAEEHWDG